ncbi:hypothetical protein [Rhizobium sp. CC-YZS058]|uniref:hypothetical protein n=1 Tax=Rhizobium sp. CC-YZS058 TaxID=3042153 RepID=UPI002B056E7D|nr:hypothetical protein [Rhizobium sp. CC-YZS058]MEA3535845.1 hypothetical protein [Rhizobium sp. CC-YZS058]
MAGKTYEARNREQTERQRKLRAKNKAEKRPGRDDFARVALHWMIQDALAKNDEQQLDGIQDELVYRLVEQGFDEAAANTVFDDLVERYGRERWGFRRKMHLFARPNEENPED